MVLDLRTGLVILRFYAPLLEQLARGALASAAQVFRAFWLIEAQGEIT